ncbi:hypothetical protein Chor_012341 [Crotalus horridus]
MHFQRFVAWENRPSLTSKSDDFESSSSSKSGSVSEYESEGFGLPKVTTTKKETMPSHPDEIPLPVKQVLDKIEVAQLERAKKEISKKLFRILENVNRAYDRYKRDDGGMLKKVRLQEKLLPSEEMVEKMEMDLMNFIEKIEVNVQRLIKLFQPLFTEKMRARRKSGQKYVLLFKAWRDKVAETPQEGEPLTPEQMLDDESLAFARCHDVNNMIHELGESSFFNKAEIIALKYTATMVGNLIKAFSLLVKQCRNLKLRCDSVTILESRKQDPQVVVLQRELRMALDKKAALEKQVQSAEERCMALLITNEMIQKELHDANEKTLLAGDITLSRPTSGKTQSKPSEVEKNVKSKQVEKPIFPIEPKKKLTRKGEGEILDEKWESQGEGSQASLIPISEREQTPTGSIQDITIKQRRIKKDKLPRQEDKLPETSDKWKAKQPPMASDEKGPPMVGTFIERSSEQLNKMFTSHRTLDTESDRGASKSSDEKPIESSPSAMKPSSLTEPTAEDISGQTFQKDKKGARHRLSLKGTADKIVVTMKTKKLVKFPPTKDTPTQDIASQDITPLFTSVQERPEGELTQRPVTTSETKKEPESLDKTLTQTATAEEAPKQLADKSKDIREKKEPKRWSKLLQLPKQAEKFEGVRHGLDVKLKELARDIPTSDIPIQDISTPDTPTQDTPTQDLPTLDTLSQDTPTEDTFMPATSTPEIPTQDTPIQDISRGELTQRPTMTSETKEWSESQDKDLTQTVAAEQIEEAPKSLADKAKDTREKKETKRWSKLLQLPKQAEKFEGVKHGLDAKLKETARDILIPDIPTPDTPIQDTPTQDISGSELTQRPTTTSEMKEKPESQDKDLTQTTIAEQAEEAPKQLADKSKDIREKKETKRWNKLLLLPKKAEKLEGVRHGLDAKLQEIARDISTSDTPTRDIPTQDTPAQDIPGGELTEKPTTETKEEPESQDKDLIQTAIAEQTEEAPKPLADKSKDIREKKETKRWSKLLQLPKQAEKFEGVIHGLNLKLQEIAREKDGMIDIETIKHFFEELEQTSKDTAAGPVTGGRHAERPAKIFSVKKSILPPDTAEQASTAKEKRRSSRVEETALREFQEATLACLEDKLEKLKKGPPGNGKVSVQFQPTDPHVQQLFKAIHDKVEECFLIKQKSFIRLEDDTVQHISQSMEKLEDKNGEEITKTPSSTYITPTQDIHVQDTPTQDMPTLFTPTQETPTQVTPTRDVFSQDTSPQDIPTLVPSPPPQEIPTLITPPKDIPTQVLPPGFQDIPPLVPPPQETPPLFLPPQDIPTLFPQSQDIPSLFSPPQDMPPLVSPHKEIPTLFPPPRDIPTLVLPPQDIAPLVPLPLEIPPLFPLPQDIPTLVPLPPSQDIPPLVPPLLEIPPLVPPPQDIPTLVPPPQVIPSLVPLLPAQDISPLVPPLQDIPTLFPPPPSQDIPPLVLAPQDILPLVPPPQDIPILVPPQQDIPTLFLPPQDILTLVPPPLEIPPLVSPPLEIPPLVLPPQDIPTLVPPPQVIPTLLPPLPPQDIPPLLPPPQDIPTLFPPPPPRDIPPLVLAPQDIPTLFPPPPPQDILTLVPPHLDITTLVPPPEDITTLVLPPQDIPILVPPPQGKESFSPQDVFLPKWQEKEEDLAKTLPITKEEQSLEHVPDEGDQQVKELKQEEQDKNKIIIPISEEQPKIVDKAREPSPKVSHLKLKSLQELNIKRELWYQQLQKELLTEKERIQEEQLQLREECQRIEKDKENLAQWQGLFQKQQEEWKQKQEQHKEQEHLWQLQLEHWQRLQQQNDHYQQFWTEQREKQKEQQCRLQEEVRQLQQQYKQQVVLQGEQAKEQWCWNQLREEHRKQQEIWQKEDKEHEIKRKQWQQQQAKHEEHMETLRQAHLEQEEQYKQWQKEQQQKQQELEHIREKRWQQQLQSWQQEMQKQQAQEHRDQEQKSKVPEKQRLIQKEHKPPSPKLKVVESSVLDIFVKPCKMPPVSKEKIITTTPRLTPSSSIALKEDSSDLETTWFPKMFTKIEELPTYDITEKRYWINVEAQRKNLKLLREASQKAGISPDLYSDTKETIKQALHSNVEKLALLFRKYKSFYNLHEVR